MSSSKEVMLCSRSSLSRDLGVGSSGLGRLFGRSVSAGDGRGGTGLLTSFSGFIFSQEALRLEFLLGVGALSS